MIVNPYTVAAVGVDVLSFCLAAGVAALACRRLAVVCWPPGQTGAQRTEDEERLYLLFWMGAVLLFLRLSAWPLFYLTLHSWIPEVQGAMCLFGTRNLLPDLTRLLELLKPLLAFFAVIWLALFRLERSSSRQGRSGDQGQQVMTAILLVCGVLALIDAGGGLTLWLRAAAEFAVSCCTTVTDIPSRFTVWLPQALLGPGYERPLLLLFFGVTLSTVALALAGRRALAGKRRGMTAQLAATATAAMACAVVTFFALVEVIGPMIMDLPFHHCLYCLMDEWDAPVMVVLFAVGVLFAAVPLFVWLAARSWAEAAKLAALVAAMLGTAAITLAASLVMNSVHLAAWLVKG